MESVFGFSVGTRVVMSGNHPWAGHAGEVVSLERTAATGPRPVVRLDGGGMAFVMHASHAKREG